METKPSLFKSRKFRITIVDALMSIVSLIVTAYLSPENVKFVLAIVAILQPVIYALIQGLTTEDVAVINAKASLEAAKISRLK